MAWRFEIILLGAYDCSSSLGSYFCSCSFLWGCSCFYSSSGVDLVCWRITWSHWFLESSSGASFGEICYLQSWCFHSSSEVWSLSFAKKTWTALAWPVSFRSSNSWECCQQFGSRPGNCQPGFDCSGSGFTCCRCQSFFDFFGFAGSAGFALVLCPHRRIDFYPVQRSGFLGFTWRADYYSSQLKWTAWAAGTAGNLEYFVIELAHSSSICLVWCNSLTISLLYTTYRHLWMNLLLLWCPL